LQFIYIAVPKTGSSSIEATLEEYNSARLSKGLTKHTPAKMLKTRVESDFWNQSFKAALVREPFDWMYSWYRFRQRDALKNPAHRFHHRYTGNMSFDEFVQQFNTYDHMLRQSDFICDQEGKLLIDFVGRVESLQSDFDYICSRIGISSITLPLLNVSKQAHSQIDSLSASSKARIERIFKPDFELFGY
jgi:hypothetical protein